ncbi:MAG: putative ABC transporter permease [Ruminococcus sp.]|jgi:uncharacterized membrane protein
MYQYTAAQWMLCFYIYSFLGWCWESLYVSCLKKRWVNRGFMRGPFLPIYGSGALIMLIVSEPFKNNILLTYIAGMIGATLLELVTGAAMEALFRVRYWDYSRKKFNFKGYICLSSSLAWGAFTVLMNLFLHKPVNALLRWMPPSVAVGCVAAVTVVGGTDFVLSFIGALNLRNMLGRIERLKEEVAVLQHRLDARVAFADPRSETEERIREAKEKLRNLIESRKKLHRGRILGNPTMVSQKYQNALEDIRKFIRESKKK